MNAILTQNLIWLISSLLISKLAKLAKSSLEHDNDNAFLLLLALWTISKSRNVANSSFSILYDNSRSKIGGSQPFIHLSDPSDPKF